jgi:argininosuccinate lyase
MKLWEKGQELNKDIEKFVVGNDHLLDQKLVKYDCQASIAHALMLEKIGVLTHPEVEQLVNGLKEVIGLAAQGKFCIKQEDEDCHTAIENYLTEKLGGVGKKIHTARSRNDQVLTALRLYEKAELKEIKELLAALISAYKLLISKYGNIQMPGYTHMQKAMPTTVEVWIGSFISAAEDDLIQLESVLKLVDQSPLGSAAGFGVPVFNIDKEFTASQLDFAKVMENPLYCQLSRGKFEAAILHMLGQIMFDLNKLTTDLMLFSMAEFSYVSIPAEFCTGSSIMPQKCNPDVLELIRAKYHVVLGEEFKVKGLIANLISGYNKDLQLTKEPLFVGIDTVKECLKTMALVLTGLTVSEQNCKKALTPELFATETVYKLVKQGLPFRFAYQKTHARS